MEARDLAGVKALSDRVHPGLAERVDVFADRLAVFAPGSLVLADGISILGYAVSHPGKLYAPPPLDHLLVQLPPGSDAYYIHDVVIAPERRGEGLAEAGVHRVLEIGAAFPVTALISVYGTMPFWERFGFRDATAGLASAKLSPYGESARYMIRRTAEVSAIHADLGCRAAPTLQKD